MTPDNRIDALQIYIPFRQDLINALFNAHGRYDILQVVVHRWCQVPIILPRTAVEQYLFAGRMSDVESNSGEVQKFMTFDDRLHEELCRTHNVRGAIDHRNLHGRLSFGEIEVRKWLGLDIFLNRHDVRAMGGFVPKSERAKQLRHYILAPSLHGQTY